MEIKDDKVIFSTGNEHYAFMNIIGLSPELEVTYGSDGRFGPTEWAHGPEPEISAEEWRELADYMIGLWTKFREKHSA